jgi:uncharacterized protein YjbI with pentapeptide repeats
MTDMRFGAGLPPWIPSWVPTATVWASGALAGGLIKGIGTETAKRGGDRLIPPKPGELRKESLTDGKEDIDALETLNAAQDYFTTHLDKNDEPLIRSAWSEKVKRAIYQLWIDRKISGDFSNYLLSYKNLKLPGVHLNGLVLEAAQPNDGWITDLKFWKNKSEKLAEQIERSRQLTNQRVESDSLETRKQAESNHPPRHRGNLNGLEIPDADIEQSAIINGRLHDSNMDRLKARNFQLTGTYARNLSVKDAQIDKSQWNEMGLHGGNLENTEAFATRFDDTRFNPHTRRGLPAANMRRFRVVKQRFSPERAITSEGITTFRRSNLKHVDLTESHMEEPDMSEAQLGGAKVFRSVWQAPNLTKAGLAGLIGFRSAEFQPVPNTVPYKKHPLLALAQATTKSEVNATWDKWFKLPLHQQDIKVRKRHQTKRSVMKQADISGLNFKDKNLKHFDLTKAKAHETDLSQSYIGRVPMEKYVRKVINAPNKTKQNQLIERLKTYLPKMSGLPSKATMPFSNYRTKCL